MAELMLRTPHSKESLSDNGGPPRSGDWMQDESLPDNSMNNNSMHLRTTQAFGRRKRKNRARRQRNFLLAVGATLIGLVLLVVHVEVSLLNAAAKVSGEKIDPARRRAHELVQQQPSNDNNNDAPQVVGKKDGNVRKLLKAELEKAAQKTGKDVEKMSVEEALAMLGDNSKTDNSKKDPQKTKTELPKMQKTEQPQQKQKTEQPQQKKTPEPKKAEPKKEQEIQEEAQEEDNTDDYSKALKDAAEKAGKQKPDDTDDYQIRLSTNKKLTSVNPEVAKAVAVVVGKAAKQPEPRTANFCANKPKVEDNTPVAPAVIIMGMEDTSTDLLWHVLERIAPRDSILTDPQNRQPNHIPKLEFLNHMDPAKEERFWKGLKEENHGHWVQASLCSQQIPENRDEGKASNLLGFPWLTLITKDSMGAAAETKIKDSLDLLDTWPKHSIKVIRYRRNLLDMMMRMEQYLHAEKEQNGSEKSRAPMGGVTLDAETLKQKMGLWALKEENLDKLLEQEQIPHIVVHHEVIFPFNEWSDLLDVINNVESYQVPLNMAVDYTDVPPDEKPEFTSNMEQEWKHILKFLQPNAKSPISLYDIFHAAESFTRKDQVFWTQQNSLTNYDTVQQVLKGSRFELLVRGQNYEHNYYGSGHKPLAMEPPPQEEDDPNDSPEVAKAVAGALGKIFKQDSPKTANFCSPNKPKVDNELPVAPAVIVMGMEDTSTDLLWHVLERIAPPNSIAVDPENRQPDHIPKYQFLNHMDPAKEEEFWDHLKRNNHGHWVQSSLCSQQLPENRDEGKASNLLGFPWLTIVTKETGKTTESKIKDSLDVLDTWPQHSIRVIRYRRNYLDMVIRMEQYLKSVLEGKEEDKAGGPMARVTLDKDKLLHQLQKWKEREDAIDKMLVDEKIPHILVHHATIFPFTEWNDLENVAKAVESYQVPLNIAIDYANVPADEQPPEPTSAMEKEWNRILNFIQPNARVPVSLYDIFHAADSFLRKDQVFWSQQNQIINYDQVEHTLGGTEFQMLLRKKVYKPDYYGCCNDDKDAGKKLFKGWKKASAIAAKQQ